MTTKKSNKHKTERHNPVKQIGELTAETKPKKEFFVVGIGASAGGLEALETFFSNMAVDSDLAFVVVQHLSPDYKSLMAELLSKHTSMPVHEAQDGLEIKPNNVYLIPRKKNMTVFHYQLHLTDRGLEQGLHLPIDIFLKSLAEDLGEKAIAIILSGTGSDGTRGIRAVKEQGGMVMAQDEYTAKFDGMPRSAVATQLVDYVLPPDQMAKELVSYVQHPFLALGPSLKSTITTDEDTMSKIFAVLRSRSGVDFSYYKQSTMVRRIERRMSINQIQELGEYLAYLYRAPGELDTLYKELLIGVTQFFRDEEAFEFLRQNIIPQIFEGRNRNDQIRVWVAGCSTGEEAYSLAILLQEFMEQSGKPVDIKVFATDIDQEALEFASRGIYPESIAADVNWEHLKQYFIKKDDSYEIIRPVREMVIFARQNLVKDPPFSKIDLISCRNVLIYLQPVLQKKVLTVFQFALKQDAFLFLGTSETIGIDQDAFFIQHNKWKIFQYKGGYKPSLDDTSAVSITESGRPEITPRYTRVNIDTRSRTNTLIYHHLIESFLSTCVIVNQNYDLLHAFGDTDKYLKALSGGAVSLNILKMVRQDLSIALSTAIHRVLKEQEEVIYKNMTVQDRQGSTNIDLIAKPFNMPNSSQCLVFIQFQEVPQIEKEPLEQELYDIDQKVNQRIADLEQELQYTKENLQATIEELETSNEELQATNEELLAANEELQSTNEELQSVNEELITVNAELQAKIVELTELNNDMNNLLRSTDIGTIFLDSELRVRKFTPAVQQDINLMELDIGRPLSHISHNIQDCDLVAEAQNVLKTLKSKEREIQSGQGQWYLMKIHPYRTIDDVIRGIVITLIDITRIKSTEAELRQSENRYRAIVEDQTELICRYRSGGVLTFINEAYCRYFDKPFSELIGQSFLPFIISEERMAVETMIYKLDTDNPVATTEYRVHQSTGEIGWQHWTHRAIVNDKGQVIEYQAVGRDITKQKQTDMRLRQNEEKYRLISDLMSDYIYAGSRADEIMPKLDWIAGAFERITGYTPAEIETLPHGWLSVIYTDDMPKITEFSRVVLRPGIHHTEYRIMTKAGEVRWLRDSVRSFWDEEQPTLLHLVGAVRDITTRKRVEANLRESEARYRFLAEITFEGISITENGQIIDVNRAFVEMFKSHRSDVIGRSPLDFVAPPYREIEKENLENSYDKVHQIEALRQDGNTFPAEIQAKTIAHEGRLVRVTAIRDITQRRRNELYRALAKNLPNGTVLLFDDELRYTLAEGQILTEIGLSKAALEGKTIWELFPSEPELTEILETNYRLTLTGKSTNFEVPYAGHNFLVRTVPLRNERGEVTAGMALAQDITEQEPAPLEILLIENDPKTTKQVQEMMLSFNIYHLLHIATDGNEGLEFLRQQKDYQKAPRPGLILLDLGLSKVNGRDLLAEIKADPTLQDIPLLILTGSTDQQDVLNAYHLKAKGYLSKPFDRNDLFKAIYAALDTFRFVVIKDISS